MLFIRASEVTWSKEDGQEQTEAEPIWVNAEALLAMVVVRTGHRGVTLPPGWVTATRLTFRGDDSWIDVVESPAEIIEAIRLAGLVPVQ